MNYLSYCSSVLHKMLDNSKFQVWAHNDFKNESKFICGNGQLATKPPLFLDLVLNRPTYKVKCSDNRATLYFLYAEGHQIAICLFQETIPFSQDDIHELFHLFHIFALKKVISKRESELDTIIDSMLSITPSLEVNEVLENIMRNALNVISASDAGYLLLFNEDKKRLIPKVYVGFNDSILNFQPKVGEGITGKVFEDGKGRIFNSKVAVDRQMDSFHISDPNLQYIQQAIPRVEGAICVPIPIGDKRIGVIIVHQRTLKRKLTKHDLNILEGFAAQAGVAIQNAKFHMETAKQLEEITTLSKELAEKNKLLQQRYDIHERLMSLSLKNKGINTLIGELGKMLQSPLLFFNKIEQRFYTPKINDMKHIFSAFEINRMLHRQYRLMHIRVNDVSSPQKDYYIYPLHNGTILLGCFILPADETLSKSDRLTLEQGGTALTLELVRRTTNTRKLHQKTYEQFQRLISPSNAARINEYGKELGLKTTSYCAVAILEIPHAFNNLQYIDFDIYQLTAQLESELEFTEKVIYSHYNEVVVLVSLTEPEEINTVYDKLLSLKQMRDEDNSPIIRGGLSKAYLGLEHIKVCFEEANNVVSYLTKHNKTDFMKYERIGLSRLFVNQPPEEIDRFINEVFAPLQTESDRHQELEETLITYIKLNRSAVNTAKELHIHINTLYQRLKRIEHILNVDLNNSEDNMEIQLACYLKLQQED